jgi:DNA mismatch repair protein MutL
LIPLDFELNAAQAEVLDASLEALRAGGLDIEPFGERAYRVRATPAGYRSPWTDGRRHFDVADFIRDLGEDVKGLDRRERAWASLACHSVVRAGARLSEMEMATLVARLPECENPMHCPHGRPTIVRLEPEDIGRLFKR